MAALVFGWLITGCGGNGNGGEAAVEIELREWAVAVPDKSIAGGRQDLELVNVGVLQHELVLIATDDPSEELPLVSGMVDMRHMSGRLVGELAELLPGQEVTVSVDLEPGTYTAFCNIPGHYAAGMHSTLVVESP